MLSPGSLFHRRDKSDSSSTSVATAAAQVRMASREAEKKAGQMSSPVTSKNNRDPKKHVTSHKESRSPSSTAEAATKRSAPKEDCEVPKKKSKGFVTVKMFIIYTGLFTVKYTGNFCVIIQV